MEKDFKRFMSQLKETNATLDFYTDFNKIRRNVQNIEISLNMLNFLLGKDDLYSAVKALWDRDPKVFNVLDILIATRREGKKKFIDVDGEIKLIKTLFSSVDGIMKFFNETGLADFFKNKDVHDLVDYITRPDAAFAATRASILCRAAIFIDFRSDFGRFRPVLAGFPAIQAQLSRSRQ